MTATLTADPVAPVEPAVDTKKYKLGPLAHVLKLVWGAIFSHVGLLIVVALYYIIFETTGTMNNAWHHLVPNGNLRHEIRNVGEGVLGAFLAKGIMWNHFTKSHERAGRLFDFIQNRFRFLPAWLSAIVTTAIVFALAFWAGTSALHALSVHSSTGAVNGSLLHRTATLWNSNWDQKALGFLCAFLATRPMHAIFDDVQAYFAGRRASLGRKPHFWYPKAFKNRYKYLVAHPSQVRSYSAHVNLFMRFGVLAGIGLAAYGYYILTYVA